LALASRAKIELAEDYRRMIYPDSRQVVEKTRAGFVRKSRLRS
jgi:hypothetical protein